MKKQLNVDIKRQLSFEIQEIQNGFIVESNNNLYCFGSYIELSLWLSNHLEIRLSEKIEIEVKPSVNVNVIPSADGGSSCSDSGVENWCL